MEEAYKEALLAFSKNEIPVGCVIVKDNKIIGRGHNLKETSKLVYSHAEINAIADASKNLNNWRLNDCSLYVTLEPCAMCMGAIMQSQISNVYFSVFDKAMGCCGSKLNLFEYNFQNPKINVFQGLLEEESKSLLQEFFKKLRSK
ncbi:MAG: nucleoside deaminase [bacterium]|nr:nucleoside deaminase [bacterium]